MAHIPNRAIKIACDHIVDCWGPKGKAVEQLTEMHNQLTTELERTTEWERQMALKVDLAFLEGYMETPAAKIADITATQKRIKH